MSAQTIREAHAPTDIIYKAEVLAATWGHLAPHKDKQYHGRILYAVGCYDSTPTPIACEFPGLPDSPWFFNAMTDFLMSRDDEPGVYEFTGSFYNYEFQGLIARKEV